MQSMKHDNLVKNMENMLANPDKVAEVTMYILIQWDKNMTLPYKHDKSTPINLDNKNHKMFPIINPNPNNNIGYNNTIGWKFM